MSSFSKGTQVTYAKCERKLWTLKTAKQRQLRGSKCDVDQLQCPSGWLKNGPLHFVGHQKYSILCAKNNLLSVSEFRRNQDVLHSYFTEKKLKSVSALFGMFSEPWSAPILLLAFYKSLCDVIQLSVCGRTPILCWIDHPPTPLPTQHS